MANALYAKGRQAFLDGDIDWSADTIKAILVDTGVYTLDLANDNALDDIPVGARIGTAQTLGTKSSTDGVADAADVVFPAVVGASAELIVLYKDTGVESSSLLICAIDTATGLPVTPNGGPITVVWDNGANKIFKL